MRYLAGTDDSPLLFAAVWERQAPARRVSAASQESLAKRVCDNDAGLEMSGEQASVAYNLFAYLGDGDGRDMSAIGTLMSSLALVIWTLSVVRELLSVCTMSRAVCAIPRGSRTRCSLAGDGGDTLTYQAISSSRLCALFITYAGRVALVVFLLIYGSLFLVYTIPLGDLLLNAVALEIVTTVDEVLFETLVPARVRRLVRGAAPLRVRAQRAQHNGKRADTGGCISSIVVRTPTSGHIS